MGPRPAQAVDAACLAKNVRALELVANTKIYPKLRQKSRGEKEAGDMMTEFAGTSSISSTLNPSMGP